ncbi:MAG TPA: ribulose-phosphate 3-epimerase [Terriglobia bacterium]|nr:ribulose-phosphate 3-epimerase [Terriglobia bacterium]
MPGNSALRVLRGLSPTLSIGILTADLARLGSEADLLEHAGAHLVHFDVMDGCFCPPITFGPPVVKAVKTRLFKDVHLMIDNPLDKVKDFAAAGADIVTVHVESCRHIHRVLQAMGSMTNVNDPERGLIRGVAINPGTPVEMVEPLLDELELVLLLAVNPGWGGQPFIPATNDRIAQVKRMISEAGHDVLLAVDGGITRGNVAEVAKTGVDLIVTGSAVFDGKAPEENAKVMLASVEAG